jgi:hypothetical protein
LFSLLIRLETRHHSIGPVTHCCLLPGLLLRGHAFHCLLRHGSYWRLRRRRLCIETSLVYSFCAPRKLAR